MEMTERVYSYKMHEVSIILITKNWKCVWMIIIIAFLTLVDRARLVTKLASFFYICFCSLFLLFVGLDRAQNTKGIEIQMSN